MEQAADVDRPKERRERAADLALMAAPSLGHLSKFDQYQRKSNKNYRKLLKSKRHRTAG